MHRDHHLLIHGSRFHYTEWGDPHAAPVVLLHGVTGHARTWDDEARALAARHRVLVLDQRGHGDSDPAPDGDYTTATLAHDLAAFLDALGLARVGLVGLSLGGRVAIALAGGHPARVERLVVVDIGPEVAAAGRTRVGMMMGGTPERFETLEEALAYSRAGNPRYTESQLRARVEHGVRPLPGGGFTWKYDRGLREAVRLGKWRDPIDLWPLWSAIACPTLLVRGEESDILSPEIARRMLDTQPRARLIEVPGAGHTVPGDQPDAFRALLGAFLAS
jgi:esterase